MTRIALPQSPLPARSRTDRSPAWRRRAGLAASVVVAAAALAACGSDDDAAPASGSAPIVVPSAEGSATATDTATPSPTADPSPSAAPAPRHDSSDDDARAPRASAHVTDNHAELDVEDQAGDGRSVRLEEVVLTDGTGFVAVFDASGRLLGSAPVSRASRPVAVPLDERVRGTSELVAVLYADDGDGRFDPAADPAVVDDDGEVVDEDFTYRVR